MVKYIWKHFVNFKVLFSYSFINNNTFGIMIYRFFFFSYKWPFLSRILPQFTCILFAFVPCLYFQGEVFLSSVLLFQIDDPSSPFLSIRRDYCVNFLLRKRWIDFYFVLIFSLTSLAEVLNLKAACRFSYLALNFPSSWLFSCLYTLPFLWPHWPVGVFDT